MKTKLRIVYLGIFWGLFISTLVWLHAQRLYHDAAPVYPLDYQLAESLPILEDDVVELTFRLPYDGLVQLDLLGETVDQSNSVISAELFIKDSNDRVFFQITGEQLQIGPLVTIELPGDIGRHGQLAVLKLMTEVPDSDHPLRLKRLRNLSLELDPYRATLVVNGEEQPYHIAFRPVFTNIDSQIMSTDRIYFRSELNRVVRSWLDDKPGWVRKSIGIWGVMTVVLVSWWWWEFLNFIAFRTRDWWWIGVGLGILYLLA